MTPGTKATITLALFAAWFGAMLAFAYFEQPVIAMLIGYTPLVLGGTAMVWFLLREAFDPDIY